MTEEMVFAYILCLVTQLASSFSQSKEKGNSEECASSPGNANQIYKEIVNKLAQAETVLHWTVVKVKSDLFP